MMSPAAMYSLALTTMAWNASGVMLDRKGEGVFPHGGGRFDGPGGLEEVGHRIDPAERLVVDRPQVFLAFREGAGDDLDRVADVVEDDERVGDHEDGIVGRNAFAGPRGELLEVADHVVAEKPHGAPEEPRQTLHRDGPVTAEELLQKAQGIAPVGAPLHRAVFLDDDLIAPDAEDGQRGPPRGSCTAPIFPLPPRSPAERDGDGPASFIRAVTGVSVSARISR